MSGLPDVRVGQVWADNDVRTTNRVLRVEKVTDKGGVPFAVCLPVDFRTYRHVGGRPTRIAVRRFKPTSTGYRLVRDAPASSVTPPPRP